jgi:hypothetical protein
MANIPEKKLKKEHSIILSIENNHVNRDLLSSNFSAATFQNKDVVLNSKNGT